MSARERPIRSAIGTLVVAAAASLAAVAAVEPGPATRAPQPARNPTAGPPALAARWSDAWNRKDLEAVLALYADDAVFMPSTGSRSTGRAEVRALFAKAFASYSGSLRTTSQSTEASGSLMFDSGDYVETTVVDGKSRTTTGNYLLVARQVGANDCRIVQHMWTDAPAAK